jgi:putative ABC transport system permease protein
VQTTEAVATAKTAAQTGGQDLVFLVFVMTFAAIALLIAAMVITNTFQVLIAQRTRALALLRCIGAGTGQLYRSVLLEAAILGAVASAVGILTGALLVQATLVVAPNIDLGVPLPATVTLTWQSVVLPLVVGMGVTVLAALAPARSATRVAPLVALRPSDAPTLRARSGRARLVVSLLALVGGFALLGLGVFLGMEGAPQFGLVAAVGGGAVAFFGVVLSAVLWLPRVAAVLGALVARTGPASRLAVANTLRNPRRTAATSTALLIGVTLVTMVSTGAASARMSADSLLDEEYPYDVSVPTSDPTYVEDLSDAVGGTSGITATAFITKATVTLEGLTDTSVLGAHPPGPRRRGERAGRSQTAYAGLDPADPGRSRLAVPRCGRPGRPLGFGRVGRSDRRHHERRPAQPGRHHRGPRSHQRRRRADRYLGQDLGHRGHGRAGRRPGRRRTV